MRLDAFASEKHYYQHASPVWAGMRRDQRGTFYVEHNARVWGLQPGHAVGLPSGDDLILVSSFADFSKLRNLRPEARVLLIEHGVGQTYPGCEQLAEHGSYSGGEGYDGVVGFLSPSERVAQRWRDRYPGVPAAAVGSPRLDLLQEAASRRRSGSKPCCGGNATASVVAFAFHWDGRAWCKELSWAYPYFAAALHELRGAYRLLGHGHPRVLDHLRPEYAALGAAVIDDLTSVAEHADLLVCDNSSVAYEFAACGKPVLMLDSPEWRRDVSHGLRFWDAVPGLSCSDPGLLLPMVGEALSDPPPAVLLRRHALEVAYGGLDDGRATERAVRFIEDMLNAS